jgi:general secretion pathway protein E
MPSVHGEDAVIRILDKESISEQFSELRLDILGFPEDELRRFRKYIAEPYGMVLVTGPTGSGKTTTLYTALRELTKPDVKVFTVEDPIEYQLAGVNQVQVQPGIGLDFPNTLRAILRQDPDIIMIGEIRDTETARIAIQASLTGHLVFSTLHTNSAAASITRLIDMGVENYLIASTVKAVLAQRLVRRLC